MRKTDRKLPRVASPSIDPARPADLQPCATCRFKVVEGPDTYCHRLPPHPFPDPRGGSFSIWPVVTPDAPGCGQHEEG